MRPERDVLLMGHAHLASLRATCSRQSVGVVIARSSRILVTGYNGAPAGMTHCDHSCDCAWRFNWDHPTNPMTDHEQECTSRRACYVSVHAEANAIAYAARWGIRLEGSTLVTTHSPCLACGQLVVNAGIDTVIWGTEHRDMRGLELVRNAGLMAHCLPLQDAIALLR